MNYSFFWISNTFFEKAKMCWMIITPPCTKGGVKIPPPPRFFSNLEKTGKNFVKIFFLPVPNSFPDILKKKSCKSVKRLGHSNYVLEVYGGGDFLYLFSEPTLVYQGGWFWPPCRIFVYRPILMKFWYDDVISCFFIWQTHHVTHFIHLK